MSVESKIAELLAEAKKKDDEEMEDQEMNSEPEDKDEDEDSDESEVQNLNPAKAMKTEDISVDVSADVAALTEGEELTEEFKEKAATIFEAAVVNRVKEELTKIDEQYQIRLNEEVEEIKEGLIEQIDGYLDYVVEQWIEQNEIALDQGLKSEVLEGFIGGLKNLFEEHYIDVPEEKYDVMGALQEEVQDLQSKLDEQINHNINLKQKVTGLQIKAIAESLAESLVETDKVKFFDLIEDLEVDSVESFERKAQVIKESYFVKKPAAPKTASFVSDNPVSLTEEVQPKVDSSIKSYISVLDKIKK